MISQTSTSASTPWESLPELYLVCTQLIELLNYQLSRLLRIWESVIWYQFEKFFKDVRGAYDKFPDFFFVWALLLIIHTWNSSPLWSNLLQLQRTSGTVATTSARPHRSHLVWACQWASSQPLSSPQLSYNDSLRT